MTKQRLLYLIQTLAALALMLHAVPMWAQSCTDTIQYVQYKNTGGTSGYTLVAGTEEYAAQAYHLSSNTTIRNIRVYGTRLTGQLEMRALVYSASGANRPVTALDSSAWSAWGAADQANGFKDFAFTRALSSSFACAIQIRTVSGTPQFMVRYTGDGEGRSEDLASVKGPATADAWVGIMAAPRNNNGDLYIIPVLDIQNNAAFIKSSVCLQPGDSITTRALGVAQVTADSMMNTMFLAGYSGGFSLYLYEAPGGTFPTAPATSPDLSVLYSTPGCYTLSLITTYDGWTTICRDTLSISVSVGVNVSLLVADSASCNPGNTGYSPDGALQVLGTGGCGSYMFILEQSMVALDTLWSADTVMFSPLAPATYTVLIRDANPTAPTGCKDTVDFTVAQPLFLDIDSTDITIATCTLPNGSITLYASGGSGSLQYSADGGTFGSSPTFTGLAGGNHAFAVMDAHGCGFADTLFISQNDGPSLALDSTHAVTCPGGNDGYISLIGTGGLGTLQYHLNADPSQPSPVFSTVSASSYTAYVVDSSACMDSVNGIFIAEPPAFTRTVNVVNVSCAGDSDGSITLTSSAGGTGPHQFNLNGGTYQVSPVFSGLAAGTYTVVTRDSIGCTDTLLVPVTQPNPLVIDSVAVKHLTCFGSNDGSLELFGIGGTAPYMYQLNSSVFFFAGYFAGLSANTYHLTIRDANGCLADTFVTLTQPSQINATVIPTATSCGSATGSIFVSASGGSGSGYTYSLDSITFTSSGFFPGLSAGSYNVWVRDGAGCIRKFPTMILNSGGPTITGQTYTNVTCHDSTDGTITITGVTGGSGLLQYQVDGGPYSTSSSFTDLGAGIHTVVVMDGLTCTDTLEVELFEPAAIYIIPDVYDVTCYGSSNGAVSIFAVGGSGGFQYSLDGFVFQPVPFFSGLSAGPYTVFVRDVGGCSGTQPITIVEPAPISMAADWTDVSCYGANDGTILVNASGGTGAFEFSLDGSSWQPDSLFTGLDGGPFFVQVRDSSLCIDSIPVVVGEPSEMVLAAVIESAADCSTATDGAIDLYVVGGNAPFAYTWTGPGGFTASSEDITGLPVGFYAVTVSDSMGCSSTDSFEVTCITGSAVFTGEGIFIYPNPAHDVLHISSGFSIDLRWEMTDLRGVTVKRGTGTREIEIAVDDLPRGVYAIRVFSIAGEITRRVVVN